MVSGCLDRIKPPPNYYDAIYLELPRQSVSLRGVVALLGVPSMLLCLGVALWLYWGLLVEGFTHDWVTNVLTVIFPVLPLWLILCFIKLDLAVPRDEPIRFNRLRRKSTSINSDFITCIYSAADTGASNPLPTTGMTLPPRFTESTPPATAV